MKYKIKMMNKESQKALNLFQIEALKAAFAENYKEYDIVEDIPMFASIYTEQNGTPCISFNAEMCFHNNEPDVWCDAVFRSHDFYMEVGFYLTDAWQSTGDNSKEIRKMAYIRKFQLVE